MDIIEAGFPAASRGDWDAVQAIAQEVGRGEGSPVICGLARANAADIERCVSAIAPATNRRVHTFIATSDIHLEYKLRLTRAQELETARRMAAFARAHCDDVEFSPEDAARSDPVFLHEVLAATIEAGATTLNIPDTVGYITPDEYHTLLADIRQRVPGARNVVISTHCHNDLGLAVANSLAGVRAGARQVECTINGIGERAGNAALEEVVMALPTRREFFGTESRVVTREIGRASRLVSQCTGVRTPPNTATVGANAFTHEAGIHQDGILMNRLTYEIMSADVVGLEGCRLVLGKHSGRHALRRHLEGNGHHLTETEFSNVFNRFKDVADKKKIVDAITEGINAVGGVTVRLRPTNQPLTHEHPQDEAPRGTRFTGFAVHTEILVATAEAYVSALNSLLRARNGDAAPVHTPARGNAEIPAGSVS